MDLADGPLWPLATGPDRTRWAAQAVERYLHLALLIMTRAATWPALEQPFSAQALEHARRLYESTRPSARRAIASTPDVLCARGGARRKTRRSASCSPRAVWSKRAALSRVEHCMECGELWLC